GLARMTSAAEEEITDLKTAPGTVMGTLGYMSPEQLRGETVDATTDIFALGCMVYEMVGGKSPFARSTATDTNAAVLRDEPRELPGAPATLMRIIRRCLENSPNARYHAARDLPVDLRSLLTPHSKPKHWIFIAIGVAAVAVAAVLAVVLTRTHPAPPPQHETRSILVLPFENESHDPNADY